MLAAEMAFGLTLRAASHRAVALAQRVERDLSGRRSAGSGGGGIAMERGGREG